MATATAPKGKNKNPKAEAAETVEEAPVSTEPSTRERVYQLWDEGKTTKQIADELALHPGSVYRYTRTLEPNANHEANGVTTSRARVMVTLADGTTVARADYIREQVAAGRSVGEVAKEVGTTYAIAYSTAHPYQPKAESEDETETEGEEDEETEGEEDEEDEEDEEE